MVQTPPSDADFGPCTAARARRLSRRVTQLYDEALSPHALTIGQFSVLARLSRRNGIGVNALADLLSADASTVSRLLKPLQAAGYLVLEANPGDRRARCIRLTDAGFDRRRAAMAGWTMAQDRVAATLGAERLALLHGVLDDAYASL